MRHNNHVRLYLYLYTLPHCITPCPLCYTRTLSVASGYYHRFRMTRIKSAVALQK